MDDSIIDPQGRFLFVKGYLADTKLTLATLYAPNTGQLDFIQTTLEKLDTFKEGELIVGGDFNLIIDAFKDRSKFDNLKSHINTEHPNVDSNFSSLLEAYNLIDVWRLLHNTERDYTYFSSRHNSYTRIDFFLILPNLLQCFPTSSIGYELWSDHNWIEFSFMPSPHEHTSRHWSLNTSLLLDTELCKYIETETKDFFNHNSFDQVLPDVTWDTFKAVIWSRFIFVWSAYKKKKDTIRAELLSKLSDMELRHKKYGREKLYQCLLQVKQQLESLETSIIQQNILYLKQKVWYKNSKCLKFLA